MTPEERLLQRKRLLTALKAAWKLNPKLRLGQLLVTAMNEMTGIKPKDLVEVEDDLLRQALERLSIKVKSMKHRTKGKL